MGDLRTEAYTSWISRVGAALIDGILFGIVQWIVIGIVVGIGRVVCTTDACRNSSGAGAVVVVFVLLGWLAFALWNWGYRQGRTGSSIGKSVLRFKVVSENTGEPIGFWMSVVRQITHFLDGICYIGYLLPLFTAKRQTIADMIMKTVCLPNEPPSARRSRTPRPRIRLALGVVVLASAAILTVLACLTSTSRWVCTGGGPYPDCGPQVSIGPIHYGAAGNLLDPYVLAALVPPLWTAGILILRRYHGAAYALVPIAGIVAIMIFAQGRFRWGWERNYVAFLACVFVTTAVCVLIARGVSRVVVARQAEEAAYRERKAARQQRLAPALPPPGWYPDPAGDARRLRHWDGRQWTEQWQYRDDTPWTSPPS